MGLGNRKSPLWNLALLLITCLGKVPELSILGTSSVNWAKSSPYHIGELWGPNGRSRDNIRKLRPQLVVSNPSLHLNKYLPSYSKQSACRDSKAVPKLAHCLILGRLCLFNWELFLLFYFQRNGHIADSGLLLNDSFMSYLKLLFLLSVSSAMSIMGPFSVC